MSRQSTAGPAFPGFFALYVLLLRFRIWPVVQAFGKMGGVGLQALDWACTWNINISYWLHVCVMMTNDNDMKDL